MCNQKGTQLLYEPGLALPISGFPGWSA